MKLGKRLIHIREEKYPFIHVMNGYLKVFTKMRKKILRNVSVFNLNCYDYYYKTRSTLVGLVTATYSNSSKLTHDKITAFNYFTTIILVTENLALIREVMWRRQVEFEIIIKNIKYKYFTRIAITKLFINPELCRKL